MSDQPLSPSTQPAEKIPGPRIPLLDFESAWDTPAPTTDRAGRLRRRRMSRTELAVAECDVGRGVFATRAYRIGDSILTFVGETFDRSHPIHGTPQGANLFQVGPSSYILPRPVGLYVNHSCNPNAGLKGTRTLIAIKEIAEGEEIRFDYSTNMDEDFWTMPCACKELECRGLVGDFRLLPEHVRARYLALGIVPAFVARRHGANGGNGRAGSNGRNWQNGGGNGRNGHE